MKGGQVFFLGPPSVNGSERALSRRQRRSSASGYRALAAAIPGNSVGEGFVVQGLVNFFGIYQNLIIVRILTSWFPALQRQPILQPLFTVCDPFLNAFRGVIPPVFGLDLSPILAITLLQVAGGASGALGAEIPPATQGESSQ